MEDEHWSNSRPLRQKSSQETLMSLLQLDPSPMDNASIYEKELPALPEEDMESSRSTIRSHTHSSSHSSSSLGLSGTAHGPLYYCISPFVSTPHGDPPYIWTNVANKQQ